MSEKKQGRKFVRANGVAALGTDYKDIHHPELLKITDALIGNGLDGYCAYKEMVKCRKNPVSFCLIYFKNWNREGA
jgi:hypothetical protein